eukprot:scaffold16062_cov81-Phaeocystis_antarctica.AAC.5
MGGRIRAKTPSRQRHLDARKAARALKAGASSLKPWCILFERHVGSGGGAVVRAVFDNAPMPPASSCSERAIVSTLSRRCTAKRVAELLGEAIASKAGPSLNNRRRAQPYKSAAFDSRSSKDAPVPPSASHRGASCVAQHYRAVARWRGIGKHGATPPPARSRSRCGQAAACRTEQMRSSRWEMGTSHRTRGPARKRVNTPRASWQASRRGRSAGRHRAQPTWWPGWVVAGASATSDCNRDGPLDREAMLRRAQLRLVDCQRGPPQGARCRQQACSSQN